MISEDVAGPIPSSDELEEERRWRHRVYLQEFGLVVALWAVGVGIALGLGSLAPPPHSALVFLGGAAIAAVFLFGIGGYAILVLNRAREFSLSDEGIAVRYPFRREHLLPFGKITLLLEQRTWTEGHICLVLLDHPIGAIAFRMATPKGVRILDVLHSKTGPPLTPQPLRRGDIATQ
ncbi:MAG TPA: hypothetical protein VGR51_08730 [Thermoplasmata archaeon]|nr:hypothetical protein [Thermoplasmata archaeon]